jgi:hypothetical protein
MLTGHGVSTRQAATLTGLVRSTATRRRNAATALTPAACTKPAVEPAGAAPQPGAPGAGRDRAAAGV